MEARSLRAIEQWWRENTEEGKEAQRKLEAWAKTNGWAEEVQ